MDFGTTFVRGEERYNKKEIDEADMRTRERCCRRTDSDGRVAWIILVIRAAGLYIKQFGGNPQNGTSSNCFLGPVECAWVDGTVFGGRFRLGRLVTRVVKYVSGYRHLLLDSLAIIATFQISRRKTLDTIP